MTAHGTWWASTIETSTQQHDVQWDLGGSRRLSELHSRRAAPGTCFAPQGMVLKALVAARTEKPALSKSKIKDVMPD